MASADPFVSLQGQVENALSDLRTRQVSEGLSNATVRGELRNELSAIEWDVQDLSEAVSVAAEQPARFGLSEGDVARRRAVVAEMQATIEGITRALDDAESGKARNELIIDESLLRDQRSGQKVNEDFIRDETMLQQQIIAEQDADLEHLASAVERIGEMGKTMHTELEEQGVMLEDLEGDLDHTQSRMRNVQKKLDLFIAQTGRRQFCIILFLVGLFLVLLFLYLVS